MELDKESECIGLDIDEALEILYLEPSQQLVNETREQARKTITEYRSFVVLALKERIITTEPAKRPVLFELSRQLIQPHNLKPESVLGILQYCTQSKVLENRKLPILLPLVMGRELLHFYEQLGQPQLRQKGIGYWRRTRSQDMARAVVLPPADYQKKADQLREFLRTYNVRSEKQ